MKAKTLIELLTLSTNIYMITKDEKFMETLHEMTEKGKTKMAEIKDTLINADDEEKLMNKLVHKANQAKEELEHKIEETAAKVYAKMNIAHTDQIKDLSDKIEFLKKELALVEAKAQRFEKK